MIDQINIKESDKPKEVYGLRKNTTGLVKGSIRKEEINGDRLINGNLIIKGTISAKSLLISDQDFVSTVEFTSPYYDQVNWSAGSIYFKSGETVTLIASNTGRLGDTTKRYVYFDPAFTTLQFTSSAADIKGNRLLLAIIEPQASTSLGAVITPVNSSGTRISGANIITGTIQSANGLTYFDLDNGKIVINDGTNDRVIIGNF